MELEDLKKGFKEAGNSLNFLIGIIDETLREENKYDSYEI